MDLLPVVDQAVGAAHPLRVSHSWNNTLESFDIMLI